MLRRLASVLAMSLAVPAAVLPAGTAAAAEAALFTVDKVHLRFSSHTSQRVFEPAVVTQSGSGVVFRQTADSVTTTLSVAPPVGQQLAAGTSFPVTSSAPTEAAGRLFVSNQCASAEGVSGLTGTVTVREVAYDADTVTALALDYDVACATDPNGTYAGSVRYGSTLPYHLLRSSVVGDPRSAVGMPVAVTVRVLNAGTATSTAGAAALSGTQSDDYAVTTDGCAGVSLAPGAECDVVLTFTPGALGERRARVDVPADGYPRARGTGTFVLGAGVAPPPTPTDLRTWPVAGGVTLSWTNGAGGPITAATVLRRATDADEWTAIGSTGGVAYTDTTLPPASAAEYSVTNTGPGGAGEPSAPASAVRLATEPAQGSVDAIVVDTDVALGRPGVVADKGAGDYVTRITGYRMGGVAGSDGGGTYSVLFGTVPGPGTYDIGTSGVRMLLGLEGSACPPVSGTLVVHEVLYDANEQLQVAAASFSVDCGAAGQVRGELRWRTTAPYQGVRLTPPASPWPVPPGAAADRTVRVMSRGGAAVTFGEATVGGAGGEYFSIVRNDCLGQTLSNGAACDVVVRATLSGTQQRSATISVADDTPAGSHQTTVSAVPTNVPGAPAPFLLPRIGTTKVAWSQPADTGNSPVTGYRVYRQTGAAEPVLLTTTADDSYSEQRVPGTTARYGVAAVNDVGAGPIGWTAVGVAPAAELVYVADVGDRSLLRVVVPPDTARAPLHDQGHEQDTVAVSPDGAQVAFARRNGSGMDLYVADADGTGTPVNLTGAISGMGGTSHEVEPAYSNDGAMLAFTQWSGETPSVWTVPVAGGTPKLRARIAGAPAWLPDSKTLVVADHSSASGALLRVAPNGTRTAIAGTAYGDQPAVSPNGRWLAFAKYDQNADVAGLAVVPVGGAPSPVLLTDRTGMAEWDEPAWRPDGTAVAATYVNYRSWTLSVREVGWNGATLAPGPSLTSTETAWGPAWRAVGVRLSSAPALTSPSARVGIQLSAPYSSATCRLDGGAPGACGTGWAGTGLSAGPHTLVVTATAAGVPARVLAHTFTVDAKAPVVSVRLPATVTTASSVVVRYAASDSAGVRSYDVRYRVAPYNRGFGAYTAPAGWTRTTATQQTLVVKAGYEYCFSVRARDSVGNTSGWSPERCVSSPVDDRALAASTGWTRATAGTAYRGTYTVATRTGATLARTGVQAKRLALVATRCPTCGSVAVYFGTTLVAKVNLASSTTYPNSVITLPAFTSLRSGTVTIKVTSSGKPVRIDGLGIRRT